MSFWQKEEPPVISPAYPADESTGMAECETLGDRSEMSSKPPIPLDIEVSPSSSAMAKKLLNPEGNDDRRLSQGEGSLPQQPEIEVRVKSETQRSGSNGNSGNGSQSWGLSVRNKSEKKFLTGAAAGTGAAAAEATSPPPPHEGGDINGTFDWGTSIDNTSTAESTFVDDDNIAIEARLEQGIEASAGTSDAVAAGDSKKDGAGNGGEKLDETSSMESIVKSVAVHAGDGSGGGDKGGGSGREDPESAAASSAALAGASRGVLCGVAMTRTRWLILALIAALVAGGAAVGALMATGIMGGKDGDDGDAASQNNLDGAIDGGGAGGGSTTSSPSSSPSSSPTTLNPSSGPTSSPTSSPTTPFPTIAPSLSPTSVKTNDPTASSVPTATSVPSAHPSTSVPSVHPSTSPTVSAAPTPSATLFPSSSPSSQPSSFPSSSPIMEPGFSFYLMGDIPYTRVEAETLEGQLKQMNRTMIKDGAEFVVHVGDMMHAQRTSCTEFYYDRPYDLIRLHSPLPTLVMIGDNDWIDCPDPAESWKMYYERFVRSGDNEPFFEDKHWTHTLPIVRSLERPENFMFVKNQVLFISVNLVNAAVIKDQDEWDLRTYQNIDWVRSNVEEIYMNNETLRGVMIFGHSQRTPDIRPFFDGLFSIFMLEENVYRPGRDIPVMYIHGDGHRWIVDNYFSIQMGWMKYVDVQVDNGFKSPPLKIEVQGVGEAPFTVENNNNTEQYVFGDGLFRIDRRGGEYPDVPPIIVDWD